MGQPEGAALGAVKGQAVLLRNDVGHGKRSLAQRVRGEGRRLLPIALCGSLSRIRSVANDHHGRALLWGGLLLENLAHGLVASPYLDDKLAQ